MLTRKGVRSRGKLHEYGGSIRRFGTAFCNHYITPYGGGHSPEVRIAAASSHTWPPVTS
jgi:hypothetical protein